MIFVTAYWGLHAVFYGTDTRTMAEIRAEQGEMATHSYSLEHPHGPQALATMREGEDLASDRSGRHRRHVSGRRLCASR